MFEKLRKRKTMRKRVKLRELEKNAEQEQQENTKMRTCICVQQFVLSIKIVSALSQIPPKDDASFLKASHRFVQNFLKRKKNALVLN